MIQHLLPNGNPFPPHLASHPHPPFYITLPPRLQLDLRSPFPPNVRRAAVVRKTPHRVHGAHLRPAVRRAEACAGRRTELGEEGVENPSIPAGNRGENVDIHFFQDMQRGKDVVMEREGKVAACGRDGAGGGSGNGVRVCHVGRDEIAPKVFRFRQIERMNVLSFRDSDGSGEEE